MMGERVSLTATKIARNVLFVASDPRLAAALPDGAADMTRALLVETGGVRPWMEALYRPSRARRVLAWVQQRSMPGGSLHLALRKRYCDDAVQDAIATGCQQVLVLGAGFDTLALRLADAYPEVRFVELDHGATARAKQHAAKAIGATRPNLELCEADLATTSLSAALSRTSWQRGAPSAIVAEGLLMYLGEAQVAELLDALGKQAGAGSRMAVSYMDPQSRDLGAMTRAALSALGEPLRWTIAADSLPAFARAHGFEVEDAPDTISLRQRYLKPLGLGDEPLAAPERLATLRRSR